MPRILTGFGKAMLFTVDRAVGRNAPNDRLDVLLVQHLLFLNTTAPYGAVWDQLDQLGDQPTKPRVPRGLRVATPSFRGPATMPTLRGGTHPKPQGDIIIDGFCGDQTIGFIEYFQEQMRLAGFGVELNGQVAPYGTTGTTTMALLSEAAMDPWKLWNCGYWPQELTNSVYY